MYVIKFVSDLRQVNGFLQVLRFSPQENLPPCNNWNIVESGINHYKPTNQPTNQPISNTFVVSDLPVYQEESYDDKYHKQEGNSY